MSKNACVNCCTKFCDAGVTDDISEYCLSFKPRNAKQKGSITACQREIINDLCYSPCEKITDIDDLTYYQAKELLDKLYDKIDNGE